MTCPEVKRERLEIGAVEKRYTYTTGAFSAKRALNPDCCHDALYPPCHNRARFQFLELFLGYLLKKALYIGRAHCGASEIEYIYVYVCIYTYVYMYVRVYMYVSTFMYICILLYI